MKGYKLLNLLLIIVGSVVVGGWLVVDIYGTEKLNPVFALVGLIVILMGESELNHMEIMEKLNEQKPT